MTLLIRSNFSRIKKNKLFWICLAVLLIYCIGFSIHANTHSFKDFLDNYPIFGLNGHPFIGIFIFLITFAVINDEFKTITIRNKLVIGYSKKQIYLSELITATTLSVLIVELFYFITILSSYQTRSIVSAYTLFINFIANAIVVCTYTAIYTCIIMNSKNSIASLLKGFTLLGATFFVVDIIGNNTFLSLLSILPYGQSKLIAEFAMEPLYWLFNTIIIIIFSAIGITKFNKSNIK